MTPSSTLQDHLDSPDITLGEHMRRRHMDLATAMRTRRAYYLDIKYWIIIRDVVVGIRTTEPEIALLRTLRSHVAAGKAFCPISESTFAELFKQRDPKTRQATAMLIDELGLGVSIVPFEERVMAEIRAFIYRHFRNFGISEQDFLPWTKLCYVLGQMHPYNTCFDSATQLAIQKAFSDHLWTISLSEMVAKIGENPMPPDRSERLARELNDGNAKHAGDLRSFQQTYAIEAQGAASVYASMAVEIFSGLIGRMAGVTSSFSTNEEMTRMWTRLLVAALTKDKLKSSLPSLHIHTCLHASLRWNKSQQFKPNDFEDFRHACAALAYCDIFLTERPLKSMVSANHISLDRLYNCKVGATVQDALSLLQDPA